MTSFSVTIEPPPQPRLAACALVFHAVAAAGPWLAHCPPALAAGLSTLALGSLYATLSRIPGGHAPLNTVILEPGACHARLAAGGAQAAVLHPASRAWGALVLLELSVDGRRHGWMLPRAGLPDPDFRRLKALIRLAC
ncbi:MAG: hypothetical protein ACT4UP_01570 [Gammaproteobacteria bacterium]